MGMLLGLVLAQAGTSTPLWWNLQGGQVWQYTRIWTSGASSLWLFPSEQWFRRSHLEGEGGLYRLHWRARYQETYPSGDPPYVWIQMQNGPARVTLGDLTAEDWDVEGLDPGRQQGLDVRYHTGDVETELLTLFSSSIPYREFLRGAGTTGPYPLAHAPVIPGSERVIRWKNTHPETLKIHRDYELSPLVGEIVLRGGPLYPEEMLEVYYRVRGRGVGVYAVAQGWHRGAQALRGGWVQAIDSSGLWQSLGFGKVEKKPWNLSVMGSDRVSGALNVRGEGAWHGESSDFTFQGGWVGPAYRSSLTREIPRGGWYHGQVQTRQDGWTLHYEGAVREDQRWIRTSHQGGIRTTGTWAWGLDVLTDRMAEKESMLYRHTHGIRGSLQRKGMTMALEWREGVDDWRDSSGQVHSWWTGNVRFTGTGWDLRLEEEWNEQEWQHTAKLSLVRPLSGWVPRVLLSYRRTYQKEQLLSVEGHLQGILLGWTMALHWNQDHAWTHRNAPPEQFQRFQVEGMRTFREGQTRMVYTRESGFRSASPEVPFVHNRMETFAGSFSLGHEARWGLWMDGAYTHSKNGDQPASWFEERNASARGFVAVGEGRALEWMGVWMQRQAEQDTLPWMGRRGEVRIEGSQSFSSGRGSAGVLAMDSLRNDTLLFHWRRAGVRLSFVRQGSVSFEPSFLVARNRLSSLSRPFWSARMDFAITVHGPITVRLHGWDESSATLFRYHGVECGLGTTIHGLDGQLRYFFQEDLLFHTYHAELQATLGMRF